MQDFTKPNVTTSNSSTKQQKWLTKDRFWNFVFWFGMSFGMSSAVFAKTGLGLITLSKVIMWSTIILVPLLVVLLNRTRFIKKDTFVNSEGVVITKEQQPKATFLALLFGIGLAFIIAETILPKENGNFFAALLFFTSLFSGISVYFIYKNCPISILFNYKFWATRSYKSGSCRSSHFGSSSSSSRRSSSIDYVTNPSYGGLNSNIYNKYR